MNKLTHLPSLENQGQILGTRKKSKHVGTNSTKKSGTSPPCFSSFNFSHTFQLFPWLHSLPLGLCGHADSQKQQSNEYNFQLNTDLQIENL